MQTSPKVFAMVAPRAIPQVRQKINAKDAKRSTPPETLPAPSPLLPRRQRRLHLPHKPGDAANEI